MLKELVKSTIQNLEGDKLNDLIDFMNDKGYEIGEWFDIDNADYRAVQLVDEFIHAELAVDGVILDNTSSAQQIDFEEIKKLSQKNKNNKGEDNMELAKELNNQEGLTKKGDEKATTNKSTKKDGKKTENGESKTAILRKYKTIDNIVYMVDAKETKIEDVKEIVKGRVYRCDINANQLAKWFLDGVLTYDPTMQRGVKEDKNNVERANFRESHVKEIYDSMLAGTFTPTQIQLAIISDDEDGAFEYDEDTQELFVNGRIRLVDGQHRVRASARIYNEIFFKKLSGVDLEDIVFNVQVHACSSDEARIIYANIDKNLKLDKSQTKQLSSDAYAKVVNFLNQYQGSDMRGKIATAKPVGNKLVLFSNLAEAIENNVEINNTAEKDKVAKYLVEFFNYVSSKIVDGFSNTDSKRVEFKKNNLLNENNFFPTWIKVAFIDQENYKANVDKIAENITLFNKDYQQDEAYLWWKVNAVKAKQKGEGFAMNNTSTGIKAMTDITLSLLGYEEVKKVEKVEKANTEVDNKVEDNSSKEGDDKGDGKEIQ